MSGVYVNGGGDFGGDVLSDPQARRIFLGFRCIFYFVNMLSD